MLSFMVLPYADLVIGEWVIWKRVCQVKLSSWLAPAVVNYNFYTIINKKIYSVMKEATIQLNS